MEPPPLPLRRIGSQTPGQVLDGRRQGRKQQFVAGRQRVGAQPGVGLLEEAKNVERTAAFNQRLRELSAAAFVQAVLVDGLGVEHLEIGDVFRFGCDRSGDFLFAALHRTRFVNQAAAVSRSDGLELRDAYVTPVARCAPPANRPTPQEIARCRGYLAREWRLLRDVRAVLVLGRIAMDGFLAMLREEGRLPSRRRLAFGHGVSHDLGNGLRLFASYHPSQQNTFTGKLTPSRFDSVLKDVRRHLGPRRPRRAPR